MMVPQTEPGVFIKILRMEELTGAFTGLYVMCPGFWQDNISYHDCMEESYHIWGESWMMQFGYLPTGGYFYRPPYINHGPFQCEYGTVRHLSDGQLAGEPLPLEPVHDGRGEPGARARQVASAAAAARQLDAVGAGRVRAVSRGSNGRWRQVLAIVGAIGLAFVGCSSPEATVASNEEPSREEVQVQQNSPSESMADWERRLWQSHVGVWESDYTIRDAEGNVVDQHHALNDIQLDLERGVYAQRNTYTRGDEVEVRRYTGRFVGRDLVIEGAILHGSSRAYDERTIVLNFAKPSLGEETYETIVLMDETHRGRSMQHYKGGELVRVTSVFGERRISAEARIDADGNDLD